MPASKHGEATESDQRASSHQSAVDPVDRQFESLSAEMESAIEKTGSLGTNLGEAKEATCRERGRLRFRISCLEDDLLEARLAEERMSRRVKSLEEKCAAVRDL